MMFMVFLSSELEFYTDVHCVLFDVCELILIEVHDKHSPRKSINSLYSS